MKPESPIITPPVQLTDDEVQVEEGVPEDTSNAVFGDPIDERDDDCTAPFTIVVPSAKVAIMQ